MLTIKLSYESDYNFTDIRREYSSMVRYAYNGFLKKLSQKEIEHSLRDKFNQSGICNSWIRKCAVGEAKSIKKTKQFYPELTKDSIKDQWKEYLTDEVESWKDMFQIIKNSGLKYRVSLDSEVFRIFQSVHARTLVYDFNKK